MTNSYETQRYQSPIAKAARQLVEDDRRGAREHAARVAHRTRIERRQKMRLERFPKAEESARQVRERYQDELAELSFEDGALWLAHLKNQTEYIAHHVPVEEAPIVVVHGPKRWKEIHDRHAQGMANLERNVALAQMCDDIAAGRAVGSKDIAKLTPHEIQTFREKGDDYLIALFSERKAALRAADDDDDARRSSMRPMGYPARSRSHGRER